MTGTEPSRTAAEKPPSIDWEAAYWQAVEHIILLREIVGELQAQLDLKELL